MIIGGIIPATSGLLCRFFSLPLQPGPLSVLARDSRGAKTKNCGTAATFIEPLTSHYDSDDHLIVFPSVFEYFPYLGHLEWCQALDDTCLALKILGSCLYNVSPHILASRLRSHDGKSFRLLLPISAFMSPTSAAFYNQPPEP